MAQKWLKHLDAVLLNFESSNYKLIKMKTNNIYSLLSPRVQLLSIKIDHNENYWSSNKSRIVSLRNWSKEKMIKKKILGREDG